MLHIAPHLWIDSCGNGVPGKQLHKMQWLNTLETTIRAVLIWYKVEEHSTGFWLSRWCFIDVFVIKKTMIIGTNSLTIYHHNSKSIKLECRPHLISTNLCIEQDIGAAMICANIRRSNGRKLYYSIPIFISNLTCEANIMTEKPIGNSKCNMLYSLISITGNTSKAKDISQGLYVIIMSFPVN